MENIQKKAENLGKYRWKRQKNNLKKDMQKKAKMQLEKVGGVYAFYVDYS